MQDINKTMKTPKPRGKALTTEILGSYGYTSKVSSKWTGHHAELIRLRDHLTGQRRDHVADAGAEPSVSGEHMADAASDSYDRDWVLAMASSDQSVLYEVNQALERIASGTYGLCELTGKPIEPDRLKALPWARFCATAQAELEARGIASRTRLGQVGSYDSLPGSSSAADEDDLEEQNEERQAA